MEPSYVPSDPTYVRAEAVSTVPPPRRKSVLGGLFLLFLLGLLGISLLVNLVLLAGGSAFTTSPRVEERYFSHNQRGKDKVAIITVEGTILDGRGFVKRQIERVVKDKSVKAVVLRVNSPGGTVSGSDFIHRHLMKMRDERQIPMVVSMGSMAASGGYYVAMAVGSRPDTIFAEPTTWTGSIGVMIPHFNAAQFMEDWGIQQDSVVSHRLKGMGSFTRKMTEEERAIFQALVDDSFAGFKDIVKQGRPKFQKDSAALDKISTGQVFTAHQALQNGLIDKIGFVEDAVEQAIKLAGLSSDDVRVVDYKPEFSLLDIAFGEAGSRQRGFDLDALVELASPKAYYLCTWLPPLLSNRQ